MYGTGEGEAICHLLEVDDVTILLDCGWSLDFNVADIEPLRRYCV